MPMVRPRLRNGQEVNSLQNAKIRENVSAGVVEKMAEANFEEGKGVSHAPSAEAKLMRTTIAP